MQGCKDYAEKRPTPGEREGKAIHMQVTTPVSDELTSYLDLSAKELKLTSQNMANVDTPGYRTVGFDFASAMQQSMQEALEDRNEEQLHTQSSSDAVSVGQVDGLLERPDGNNVSMDREGLKMAEAQLQFNTGIALLKREYTRVMDAIQADKQ